MTPYDSAHVDGGCWRDRTPDLHRHRGEGPGGAYAPLHHDVVEDYLPVGCFVGREAVLDFLATIWAASPDAELIVEHVAEAGHVAFVGWRWHGTFDGAPFQGIRPNGKTIEILGVDKMEIEDAVLRRNTVYYDGLGYARQLGMLPTQGTRPDRAMLQVFNARTRLSRARR